MASLLNNASLLINPAGSIISYQEDKIYSVLPKNGDGDFTFSGGDGGTRVNQDGYIDVTPSNIYSYSEAFDNGYWQKYQVTVTPNSIANPLNGAVTADRLDPSGATTNNVIYKSTIPNTNPGEYTISAYFKLGAVGTTAILAIFGNTSIRVTFNLSTGAIAWTTGGSYVAPTTYGIIDVGDGWYRCYATNPNNDVTYIYTDLGYDLGSGGYAYMFGAQINVGKLKPYQPTTDRLNYPRITYQNGRGALLSEPQRTNLYVGSQDFSIAYSKYQITLTANAAISPDGTQNATKFVDNTASGVYHQIEPNFSATSGVTYTMSVFVKAAEHTQFHIFAFADNGVFNSTDAVYDVAAGAVISGTGASIEKWPNGWFRCIRTLTSGATGTGYWGIGAAKNGSAAYTGDGSSGIYVWGAQNEAGEFASTYIPTTSATVTRPYDQFFNNDSPALSSTSWTFYMSGINIGKNQNSSGNNIDNVNWSFDSGNGPYTGNSLHNYSNNLYYWEQTTPAATNLGAIGTDTKKFAVTKTGNTFKLFRDGVLFQTSTPTLQGNTWDSFRMYGTTDAQGQAFSNNPSTIAIFQTNLSDAQAIELTTVRSGSGGTISYYGPYTIHTFTGSATFTPSFSGEVEVLVVAGGGGGGARHGGGGGAGGLLYASSYGVSAGTGVTVTVGAGGPGVNNGGLGDCGINGSNSVFGGLTAIGGGGGGSYTNPVPTGGASGGGGGGGQNTSPGGSIAGQGNPGGTGGAGNGGGGGGGAGAAGSNAAGANTGGNGGNGLPYSITGFSTYYAGGGGGGSQPTQSNNPGGLGGGGTGDGQNQNGGAGVAYTGGGGGGTRSDNIFLIGGTGGSGIVIVRYLT